MLGLRPGYRIYILLFASLRVTFNQKAKSILSLTQTPRRVCDSTQTARDPGPPAERGALSALARCSKVCANSSAERLGPWRAASRPGRPGGPGGPVRLAQKNVQVVLYPKQQRWVFFPVVHGYGLSKEGRWKWRKSFWLVPATS